MATNNLIEQEELEANDEITNLIDNILLLIQRHDPLLNVMKSPSLLIRGLVELRSLIEMVEIKRSIVDQIKFLLTNCFRQKNTILDDPLSSKSHTNKEKILTSKFEGHMLHSVISGNPGSGKTTVGMILAKIWTALGFLSDKKGTSTIAPGPKKEHSTVKSINNDVVNMSYRMRILDLEDRERNLQNRVNLLQENLLQLQTAATEIRKLLIKIKPGPTKSRYNIVDLDPQWDKLLNLTKNLRVSIDKSIKNGKNKSTSNTPTIGLDVNTVIRQFPPGLSVKKSKTPEPIRKNKVLNAEDSAPIILYKDPYCDVDPKFTVATREDFVAEYLGQTAPKTRRLLESALGGVLFIDEAYSLCNMDGGSKDKFGEECLTAINEFMSLHSDEIIIIFAGYKEKLLNTIFKAQAGLFRRCTWFFEIKDYTHRGLARIFTKQLERDSWKLDSTIDIEKFLRDNKEIILDAGGGTGKLAFFVKMEYGKQKFKQLISSNNTANIHDSIITSEMINNALIRYQKHLADRIDIMIL